MLLQILSQARARRHRKGYRLATVFTAVLLGIGVTWADVVNATSIKRQAVRAVRRRNPEELLADAERMVLMGEIERAIAAYHEVETLNTYFGIGANSWNKLCWYGSLWGYADEVLDACENAVALAPDNINILDSRGLARALSGDMEGAIADFSVFVDSTEDEIRKFQRQGWIDDLQAGDNPFTPDVLRLLFIE